MALDVKFKIVKQLATLSERDTSKWKKELNIVEWSNNGAKYDIREWNPEHDRCGKGVTLSQDELKALYLYLKDYFAE